LTQLGLDALCQPTIELTFARQACGKHGRGRPASFTPGEDGLMKFTADRPYADPKSPARKLLNEIVKMIEPVGGDQVRSHGFI
jgi:hypothetical protein